MPEIQLLRASAAASGLRGAKAEGRGFLGVDPVTQNDALLARELTRQGAQVYRAGDTLVGYAPNHEQPRQAFLASTSADPEPIRAVLAFLSTYQRCTSFVAMVPAGAEAAKAFAGCGFEQTGVLRDHRYQSGGYQDVLVLAKGEVPCPS